MGGGTAVTAAVTSAALARGVECATSTVLQRLVMYVGGRVVAAVLVQAGEEREVRAGAVIMTTGGFVSNPAMLRQHVPILRTVRRFLCGGAWQATGSGHAVLEAVGAAFAFLVLSASPHS